MTHLRGEINWSTEKLVGSDKDQANPRVSERLPVHYFVDVIQIQIGSLYRLGLLVSLRWAR